MTHILLCRLNFLTFFTIFLCFNFSRKTGNRYFLFFTAGRLKSNNELERVLREKKKRELEIRNAHKEQERVEKERLKLEKKVKKAEKTANRKEMGILRKNLRGKDDQPYVRSANELRDDHQPLSLSEMETLVKRYGEDAKTLEPIINEGRKRLMQVQEESKLSIDRIKVNASKYQLSKTTDLTANLMKRV